MRGLETDIFTLDGTPTDCVTIGMNKVLPGKIHTVEYEQLIDRQEEVTRDLLERCGLSWEIRRLPSSWTAMFGSQPLECSPSSSYACKGAHSATAQEVSLWAPPLRTCGIALRSLP